MNMLMKNYYCFWSNKMNVFQYMPLELWKDMAERFLDPTSFGRLRQVNRALRDKLDEESKEKMVKRCTIITVISGITRERFMNRRLDRYGRGMEIRYKNGEFHSDNDIPSAIYPGAQKIWHKEGKIHRDNDLPAVVWTDGDLEWYQNGKLHREGDNPAIIRTNGTKEWRKGGLLHRDGDLPAYINEDGYMSWWKNGTRIGQRVEEGKKGKMKN